MRSKHRWKFVYIYIIAALSIVLGFTIVLSAWPYDDVRYGAPKSTVLTPVVHQGGLLTLQNPSFCNDNQDVTIERWAVLVDDKNQQLGAYELFSVQFFNKGRGLQCSAPSVNTLTLPNYVIGVNGTRGRFLLHQIIKYQPNPVKTVTVDHWSTPFLVIPN